jgi:diguanylate cyclase (GGDEF)-like protein
MTIVLDLPTILFVLKASYFASALALAYARWRTADAAGAELIALAFVMLAIGATLASFAERDSSHYSELSLINVTLGMLGYALLYVGAAELSSRRRPFRRRWVLLAPLAALAAGWLTGFHAANWLRATVFNLGSVAATFPAAWRFYRDGRTEPLPARRIVAWTFAATGTTSLVMALEFATGIVFLPPAVGFVVVFALMFAIALVVVILAMERAVVHLARLAHTDMLTGLDNRRSFFEKAPERLAVGDAIVVFDADGFKRLNDTWGHSTGDKALDAIARALGEHVRSGDVLARYGGEEFVLFLPATGEAAAEAIARAMCAAVAGSTVTSRGTVVRVTLSAGLAVCREDGRPLDRLIRDADTALYAAKAAGGDTVSLHGGEAPPAGPCRDRQAV